MKPKIVLLLFCVFSWLFSCKNEISKPNQALASIDFLRGELLLCGNGPFGELKFSLSCNYETRAIFDLAVALLHSFQYTEAEKAFVKVIDAAPYCPMGKAGKLGVVSQCELLETHRSGVYYEPKGESAPNLGPKNCCAHGPVRQGWQHAPTRIWGTRSTKNASNAFSI